MLPFMLRRVNNKTTTTTTTTTSEMQQQQQQRQEKTEKDAVTSNHNNSNIGSICSTSPSAVSSSVSSSSVSSRNMFSAARHHRNHNRSAQRPSPSRKSSSSSSSRLVWSRLWWQRVQVKRTLSYVENFIEHFVAESPYLQQHRQRSHLAIYGKDVQQKVCNLFEGVECDEDEVDVRSTTATATSSTVIGGDTDDDDDISTTSLRITCAFDEDENDTNRGPEGTAKQQGIGLFHRSEIRTGEILGRGGTAIVYEVTSFQLRDEISEQLTKEQQGIRAKYAESVVNEETGHFRYAVKVLQQKLLSVNEDNHAKQAHDPLSSIMYSAYQRAAADLVAEAAYLSVLDHPHIVACHGLPYNGIQAFAEGQHDSYFVVTERLQETLEDYVLRQQHVIGNDGKPVEKAAERDALIDDECDENDKENQTDNILRSGLGTTEVQRKSQPLHSNTESAHVRNALFHGRQVADALRYLHDRRIIYRDLKPANIGVAMVPPFDSSSASSSSANSMTLKLIDLGLCRELPTTLSRKSLLSLQQEDARHSLESGAIVPPESPGSVPPVLLYACDRYQVEGGQDYYETSLQNEGEHIDGKIEDTDDDSMQDEMYEMSGVGTRRYMAAEVFNLGRYNSKVDVYSWSLVLWQMLTGKKPYAPYAPYEHRIRVCCNGERPSLLFLTQSADTTTNGEDPVVLGEAARRCNKRGNRAVDGGDAGFEISWPAVCVQRLLRKSWEHNVSSRFTIHQVIEAIDEALLQF